MPQDRDKLEQRRLRLVRAIASIEDQEAQISRQTREFLDWAKQELRFVETLLEQDELLVQLEQYLSTKSNRTAESESRRVKVSD